MGCDIDTGYSLSAPSTPSSVCIVKSPGKNILFSPETLPGTDRSTYFTVEPGSAVLIDAYNLEYDKHIYLNRLVLSSNCKVPGNACNPHDIANPVGSYIRLYGERMTLGGTAEKWSIIKYNSESTKESQLQLLIAIPGTYELELEDPATQLNGTMEVEYMKFDLRNLHLADLYFGGI